jgi:hypothetical protein
VTAPDRIREQRIVELCSDADATHGRADRSRLWAYGYAGIAELAGCEVEHVRQAASRRAFDPGDLLDVARWVISRRAAVRGDIAQDIEYTRRSGEQAYTLTITSGPPQAATLHPDGRVTFEDDEGQP